MNLTYTLSDFGLSGAHALNKGGIFPEYIKNIKSEDPETFHQYAIHVIGAEKNGIEKDTRIGVIFLLLNKKIIIFDGTYDDAKGEQPELGINIVPPVGNDPVLVAVGDSYLCRGWGAYLLLQEVSPNRFYTTVMTEDGRRDLEEHPRSAYIEGCQIPCDVAYNTEGNIAEIRISTDFYVEALIKEEDVPSIEYTGDDAAGSLKMVPINNLFTSETVSTVEFWAARKGFPYKYMISKENKTGLSLKEVVESHLIIFGKLACVSRYLEKLLLPDEHIMTGAPEKGIMIERNAC